MAGLGALGAVVGLIALFALLAFVSRPTPTGGMTPAMAWVTWISLAVLFLGLIGAHVVIARELLALARGKPTRI